MPWSIAKRDRRHPRRRGGSGAQAHRIAGSMKDWREWHRLGETLVTGAGVHRPSEFSALLSSTLADVTDLTVLDAGCGAGLITIAALEGGAREVIAMDRDAAALEATAANVTRALGPEASGRLALWEAEFSRLGDREVDLLAVNPPQRPEAILGAVESHNRHLHTGAGPDGLDTLRLVLANAAAGEVRTTAAAALALGDADLDGPWDPPVRLAAETLPVHPAWGAPGDRAEVGIWAFRRAEADPAG
jgi:methylase of polypeptide subunit release factors